MTEPDLEVVAFFTADHAAVENGKVYVNGGFWDRIRLPNYPAVVNLTFVVVLRLAKPRSFNLSITMVDDTGEPLDFRIESQVVMDPNESRNRPAMVPLAAPLGFTLPRAGNFTFILSTEEIERVRYPFTAEQSGVFSLAGADTKPIEGQAE